MSKGKAIAGVGLFSLVLLGVLAVLAQTAEKPPTELYVRTSPAGAKIAVDGKERGTAPTFFEIEAGEHTITARLAGYDPQTSKVTIPEGQISRVILELKKASQAAGDPASEGGDTETIYVCRRHPQVTENKPGRCRYCQRPLEGKRQAVFAKNLKQIGMAMITYVEIRGTFPPAYSTDKEGKPLLSWRVQILPLLGQEALYKRFHLDEPWDSEHNKRLISLMPEVFKAPGSNAGPGKTNYLTVRGENTAFPGQEGIGLSDIRDGLSNTIMVVEASDAKAVLWTKPEDFQYDKKDPITGLVGLRRGGFCAVLCDCSVCFIRATAGAEAVIDAMFTRNDGRAIERGEPVLFEVNGIRR